MNQAVLIHRPSTSLNNTGEGKPVTMVMATHPHSQTHLGVLKEGLGTRLALASFPGPKSRVFSPYLGLGVRLAEL